MKTAFIFLFLLIFSSCSSLKYNSPSVVYRSIILPGTGKGKLPFTSLTYTELNSLEKKFIKGKRLLVIYVSYDQFDNLSVPPLFNAMMHGLEDFKKIIEGSNLFSDVQLISLSHVKIGTVAELRELMRRYGSDYTLLVSSAYNFYKYSTTWGNFIAWFPIINFLVPFNRITGDIFLEATLMSDNGAILFIESVRKQISENTNILYSPEHFKRMAMELHNCSYSDLAFASVSKFKKGGAL